MNPEREVEIKLWDWLINQGSTVKNVFFNSKNEVMAPIFKVTGLRKIPDLLVLFYNNYTKEYEYMAIEVKDASSSKNIRDGAKIYDTYLKNYIEKKTKYLIDNKEIKINHFCIATQYSEYGHLKKKELIETNENIRGKYFGNKVVPYFEFSGTKEVYRGMLPRYSEYRKENKLIGQELPSLGILISDVIIKFDKNQLEVQSGMKGLPLYQCIMFNKNNNKKKGGFKQELLKL